MSDRIKNIVMTVVFLGIIIIMLILNIFVKDIEISQAERRKLAKFPDIKIENILDGTFMDNFEDYTMDQFIKRDTFRALKAYVELLFFYKNDVNKIYEEDGVLISQEYPLDEKSVLNIAKKINIIQEKYLDETNNVYYSIVPDKNYYTDNKYLKLDYLKLENIMKDNLIDIQYIDIFDTLELLDYYKTDTHWRQENLEKVADKISIEMGFKERLKTPFSKKEITEFKGVYSGQFPIKIKEDIINVLTNNIIEESKVYNYETNKYTKVYDLDKINSNDKYDIFLSGATPLLMIENEQAKTEKELVVFRDSFGSSIIPLFIEAYSKIIVVDTRYIATDYLKQFIEFNNKDVLFIYSTLVINNSYTLK